MDIKRSVLRYISLLAAFFLIVFTFAGCGAVIRTEMTVDSDFKGERIITVTVSDEDLQKVSGGSAALNEIASSHLPSALTYSSAQSGSDYVQVFTLSFSDRQDYNSKISELLALDPENSEPEIYFDIKDTLFKTGVFVKESFSSAALLGWYKLAIAQAGIISESESNWYELDDGELIINGQSYSSSGYGFYVDEQETACFEGCDVSTVLNTDGTFTRTIVFAVSNPLIEEFSAEKNVNIENYLKELAPEDCRFTKTESSYSTELAFEFSADTAEGIVDITNRLLQSDTNSLSVEAAVNEEAAGMARLTVSESIDASFYLDSGNKAYSTITLYPNAKLKNDSSADFNGETLSYNCAPGTPYSFEFDWQISFEEIKIKILPKSRKSVEAEISFILPEKLDSSLKDWAKKRITDSAGELFKVTSEDSGCSLSASGSPDEIAEKLNAFSGSDGAFSLTVNSFDTPSRLTKGYACELTYDLSPIIGSSSITAENEKNLLNKYYYTSDSLSADGGKALIPASGVLCIYAEGYNLPIAIAVAAAAIIFIVGITVSLVLLKGASAEMRERRRARAAAAAERATVPAAAAVLNAEQPAAPIAQAVEPSITAEPPAERDKVAVGSNSAAKAENNDFGEDIM